MRNLLLFFLALANNSLVCSSLAQDETSNTVITSDLNEIKSQLTVIKNAAGSYVIQFADGREATLMIRRLPKFLFEVPIKVHESTCSPHLPKNCKISFETQSNDLELIWTKNDLNPDRLNKEVLQSSSAGAGELEFKLLDSVVTFSSETSELFPDGTGDIKKYELSCDDYRFLSGEESLTNAPENLEVVDWSTELMLPNPETRLNENRTLFNALGSKFTRSDTGTLKLSKMGSVASQDGIPMMILGDVIGWTIPKQTPGKFCEISYKLSIDEVIATVDASIEMLRQETELSEFSLMQNQDVWNLHLLDQTFNMQYRKYFDADIQLLVNLNLLSIGVGTQPSSDQISLTLNKAEVK